MLSGSSGLFILGGSSNSKRHISIYDFIYLEACNVNSSGSFLFLMCLFINSFII